VTLSAPVLLTKQHATSNFDCGKPALDSYLQKHALGNQAGGAARTYVVVDDSIGANAVVGYYSLAPAAVTLGEAPERVRKGQAQHPVPCILLARLAVDLRYHGQGLGRSLFRDALLRALAAHEQIGGRAFLVHAMDEEARRFYEKYGMLPSPSDPLHLFLLFKDIRALLK
jgi:GNAT superfamily N-acetyltransferase